MTGSFVKLDHRGRSLNRIWLPVDLRMGAPGRLPHLCSLSCPQLLFISHVIQGVELNPYSFASITSFIGSPQALAMLETSSHVVQRCWKAVYIRHSNGILGYDRTMPMQQLQHSLRM